jgi:urease accessory protein
MSLCEQRPPLRVIRSFPLEEGGALVHLHNLSGGVLGGDELKLEVTVGPGAYAQLTTTSATRIYRSLPHTSMARQTNSIKVEQDGLLEYLPDLLIPFAEARYWQHTRIELADGAGLFWWETVTPGRTARDELFRYHALHLGSEIVARGRPLAIEHIKLEPASRSLSSPARLGPYTYFCTLYICKVGLDATYWSQMESELSLLAGQLSSPGEVSWGASALVAHGLVVRGLSRQGRDLAAGLLAFWRAARIALYGREALPPRKIY